MTTEAAASTHTAEIPQQAAAATIGLEEYYREAGPDYAAWSREFNMHFGYFRMGRNPFDREAMLEAMNAQVLDRLRVAGKQRARLLDLGCGLGATLRSFARRLPGATVTGITLVPWQVEHATEMNRAAGLDGSVRVLEGDFEDTVLPRASYDGVYALESACHAHDAGRAALLTEAHRLLRRGGRLVMADGFLNSKPLRGGLQKRIYRKLCECWVIDELAQVDRVVDCLRELGFTDVAVEHLQLRVAPSVLHIPWVTLKFLMTDVVFGDRHMTRARWNNVIAPLLLPLVSAPFGPMTYCMISATKG